MPEIGVTLREARMRAGIDIAEVESRTKIRAKYLRALENEEWSLLPGTTFVKSFLRTYAEALGLDAKLLVEEYKFRHEPYEVGGAQNGGNQRGRRGGGGRRGGAFGPPKRPNVLPILILLIVVAGAIYAVLQLSKNEEKPTATAPTTTARQRPQRVSDQVRAQKRAAARRRKRVVSLRIKAPGNESASVCVKNASGKTAINTPELAAGRRTKQVRSSEFRITTTKGAHVYDGSKPLKVSPDSRNVIAYRITKGKLLRLTGSKKPSCSS